MQTKRKKTIKTFLAVLLLMTAISTIYGQDMIVMRDGTSIDVIIIEVSPSEIKFRRADSPEGPVRTLLLSSVNMIIYENRLSRFFNIKKQQKKCVCISQSLN